MVSASAALADIKDQIRLIALIEEPSDTAGVSVVEPDLCASGNGYNERVMELSTPLKLGRERSNYLRRHTESPLFLPSLTPESFSRIIPFFKRWRVTFHGQFMLTNGVPNRLTNIADACAIKAFFARLGSRDDASISRSLKYDS